ncbi:hypothetical protein AB0J83_20850 [Actinoplanes sp. NPDC049596]|uniref:hypothetical protein n=1 Tax=unclassified Actinoplanes TaxID=2626549 RepID=UPI0034404719
MPAIWSKWDDQPLPNPADSKDGAGDSPGSAQGPSKRLQVNWVHPHVPTVPDRHAGWAAGDGSGQKDSDGNYFGGGHGNAGGDSSSSSSSGSGSGSGTGVQPNGASEMDRLAVNTDALYAWEQTILDRASDLVAQFNSLRDRSQGALSEPMWGLGEGQWSHPQHHATDHDDVDPTPRWVPSESAHATRNFVKSIADAQQGALQLTADMMTLSGSFIEMLDGTISGYAQMDMLSVFPDPADLKAASQ